MNHIYLLWIFYLNRNICRWKRVVDCRTYRLLREVDYSAKVFGYFKKRFSNKPTTLVIYYYRIKHFLPLVSKVGLLFVLFFSVLRECFFLPVSISLP